jgi:hypothetical protein
MPIKRTCCNKELNSTCLFSCSLGCYCDTDEIELDSIGQCMTYCEKDIYREVEGFKRDG